MRAPNPDSRSLIRRATHIVLLRVEAVDAGAWEEPGGGVRRQSLTMEVELQARLKGDLDVNGQPISRDDQILAAARGRAALTVVRHERTVLRVFAVPGVWSPFEPKVGDEYLLFAECAGVLELREVIAEPHTIGVYEAADAISDVSLAIDGERDERTLPELLAIARPRAANLGELLAFYLAERVTQELMFADDDGLELALALGEEPELEPVPRTILVEEILARARAPEAPLHIVIQVARWAFALLVAGHPALRDGLLADDLPGLLRLPDSPVSADQVFAGEPGERRAAQQAVDQYQGAIDVAPLRAWF